MKYLIMFYPSICFGARSLESMARSAESSLTRLGSGVVVIGLIWAGYLYVKGSQEGREKLGGAVAAAILIFGAGGIMALLKKITG
ncbi:MAG: hypothetical protein HOE90_08625 [Bacteriovoracaceae bacterium]|jgi:hypothetical protein|nr:hypothetical protein [Bacteriovoracaceae bacterium]